MTLETELGLDKYSTIVMTLNFFSIKKSKSHDLTFR